MAGRIDFSDLADPGTQAPQKIDFSDLADQDVNSPSNPGRANLFPNKDAQAQFIPQGDRDRMLMGFADPAHATRALQNNHFSSPQKNSNGDWVAQDKNGKWVQDETNFFPSAPLMTLLAPRKGDSAGVQTLKNMIDMAKTAHPINWAESHLSDAPEALGFTGGAVAGEFAGGDPGAVVGAGAGGGAGEYLKQKIGQYYGVNEDPGDPTAVADAAKRSAAAELGGKLVGKIPLPDSMGGSVEGALGKLGDALRDPAIKAASFPIGVLSGVDRTSAEQMMKNPVGVIAADGQKAGAAAGDALFAKNLSLGQKVANAREALIQSRGDLNYNTTKTLNAFYARVDEANRLGNVTDAEAQKLKDFGDQFLTTTHTQTVTDQTPWQRGDVDLDTMMYRGKHPINGKGDWTLSPVEAQAHAGPGSVQRARVGDIPGAELIPDKNSMFAEGENYPIVSMKGVPRDQVPASEIPTTVPVQRDVPIQAPAADTEKIVKGIGQTKPGGPYVPSSAYNKEGQVPQGSDAYINQLKLLSGDLRKLLLSGGTPETQALGRANLDMHEFKNDAKLIPGAQKEASQEAFANNLGGPNKSAQLQAAARHLPPDILEQIKNAMAKKDYTTSGPGFWGSVKSGAHLIGGGATAAAGMANMPYTLLKNSGRLTPSTAWSLLKSEDNK